VRIPVAALFPTPATASTVLNLRTCTDCATFAQEVMTPTAEREGLTTKAKDADQSEIGARCAAEDPVAAARSFSETFHSRSAFVGSRA